GLPATTDGDRVLACGTARKHVLAILLKPGKERAVTKQAEFGNLGIACAKFPLRQCVEQCSVGDHQNRLMKRTDQILSLTRIDSGLAADRGVDLRKQRGRHLYKLESATHAGRGETGKITDHASAKCHDKIVALEASGNDCLADLFERRIVL